MNWKNWPYWVKGGILLGVTIALLFSLVTIFRVPVLSNYVENNSGLFLGIPILLSMMTGLGHVDIMMGKMDLLAHITFLLVTFVLYFPIGAIIGSLYGKIKNRKQSSA